MLGRTTCSLALLALLTAGACSSGGSDSSAKKADKAEQTSTTLGEKEVRDAITSSTVASLKETARSDKAFCTTFGQMQTIDLSKPANTPDAIRAHYQKMLDLAPALEKASPEKLKANVAKAADITREVVESGSTDPFRTPESTKNAAVLAEYARSHCAPEK